MKTRYGITQQEIEALLAKQNGKCCLCDKQLEKFTVDHCHNTGRVRGLLCHRCNIRLGGWDDLQFRERALKYLGIKA